VDFGGGDELGCDGTGPSRRAVTSSKVTLVARQAAFWRRTVASALPPTSGRALHDLLLPPRQQVVGRHVSHRAVQSDIVLVVEAGNEVPAAARTLDTCRRGWKPPSTRQNLTATILAASIMTIDSPAAFQWVLQVEPDNALLLAPLQQETWETQPL
jgi:hypothetical protein